MSCFQLMPRVSKHPQNDAFWLVYVHQNLQKARFWGSWWHQPPALNFESVETYWLLECVSGARFVELMAMTVERHLPKADPRRKKHHIQAKQIGGSCIQGSPMLRQPQRGRCSHVARCTRPCPPHNPPVIWQAQPVLFAKTPWNHASAITQLLSDLIRL